MKLEADKEKLTIMGVKFANRRNFDAVAYAASSFMIEDFETTAKDIKSMKDYVEKLDREKKYA